MNYEYLKKIIINSNPDIASAYSVSETLGHDPFKGHGPDDTVGKSRFVVTSNNDYVGDFEGPCNADVGKPAQVKSELVETVRDDDRVKLFVYRLVPTEMVEETFGGHGFLRPPTDEEIKAGVEGGVTTRTRRPEYGNLKVANVHGCLQLVYEGDEDILEEEETTEYTVCLIKEADGWALASVYPGRPGGDIGAFLANACHHRPFTDKDNGFDPVRGYSEGEYFYQDLLVEAPPEWIYDHIVIRN